VFFLDSSERFGDNWDESLQTYNQNNDYVNNIRTNFGENRYFNATTRGGLYDEQISVDNKQLNT
jgi:hypothetical protein